MLNTPSETNHRSGLGVECLVPVEDPRRSFHDENVFILIRVNVNRGAVTRAREDFRGGVRTVRCSSRNTNREALSASSLQPLVTPFVVDHAGVIGAGTHFDLLLLLIWQPFSDIPGAFIAKQFLDRNMLRPLKACVQRATVRQRARR